MTKLHRCNTYTRTSTHTQARTHKHAHTHAHTHTHTHRHTHTHTTNSDCGLQNSLNPFAHLEVEVHDAPVVHVSHALQDLPHELDGLVLAHVVTCREVVEQLPARHSASKGNGCTKTRTLTGADTRCKLVHNKNTHWCGQRRAQERNEKEHMQVHRFTKHEYRTVLTRVVHNDASFFVDRRGETTYSQVWAKWMREGSIMLWQPQRRSWTCVAVTQVGGHVV